MKQDQWLKLSGGVFIAIAVVLGAVPVSARDGAFKCGTLLAPIKSFPYLSKGEEWCDAAINTRLILTLVVAILGVALIVAGVITAKNAEQAADASDT